MAPAAAAPTPQVSSMSPCSPMPSFLRFSGAWLSGEVPGIAYGVPVGLKLRNTFLEVEADDDGGSPCASPTGAPNGGPQRLTGGSCRQRSRSCPHVGSDSSGSFGTKLWDEGDISEERDQEAASDMYPTSPTDLVDVAATMVPTSPTDMIPEAQMYSEEEVSMYYQEVPEVQSKNRAHRHGSGDFDAGEGSALKVLLRGLPYNVQEEDLYFLLEQEGLAAFLEIGQGSPLKIMRDQHYRPTGFAELIFASGVDMASVSAKLHMRNFGKRYIEVMPSKPDKWGAPTSNKPATTFRGWNGHYNSGYRAGGDRGSNNEWSRSYRAHPRESYRKDRRA